MPLRAAHSLALGLLPAWVAPRRPHPPISFIIFARDGHGYPDLVIADLLRVAELRDRTRFFAHEFHHHYRHGLAAGSVRSLNASAALSALLTNIEFEGIADRLDKASVLSLSEQELVTTFPDSAERAYYERYRREYGRGAAWIAALDSTLTSMPPDAEAAGQAALRRQVRRGAVALQHPVALDVIGQRHRLHFSMTHDLPPLSHRLRYGGIPATIRGNSCDKRFGDPAFRFIVDQALMA